jgi:hypothetical protein
MATFVLARLPRRECSQGERDRLAGLGTADHGCGPLHVRSGHRDVDLDVDHIRTIPVLAQLGTCRTLPTQLAPLVIAGIEPEAVTPSHSVEFCTPVLVFAPCY